MSFKLISLPFEMDALKHFISEETLLYHYGKHHQTYVNKLNSLVENMDLANKSLEDLIKNESGAIFNNAAQIWNHNFYWDCLMPNGKTEPMGPLLGAINKKFESLEKFKKEFKEKALANFGSGWTWLIKDSSGNLEIINTSNAGNPLTENKTPLITCDVWEHAYYIDYRNDRGNYIDHFWPMVNWEFVEQAF